MSKKFSLEDMHFIGFRILNSGYVSNSKIFSKGKYRLDYSELEMVKIDVDNQDDSLILIILKFHTEIVGTPDSAEGQSSEDHAFKASAEVELVFNYDNHGKVDDIKVFNLKNINKNKWFFDNFMAISIKYALESILENTPIGTIELPFNRPIN